MCIKSFRLGENDNYRPNVYDSEYEIYLTAAERKAKAAPGDLIRVTKDFWSDETHIGEIYEVERVSKNGFIFVNGVWNDGSQMNFSRDEYEIYRKADDK